MKILHVSTRLILGGSQENTVLSCEGQAALGHEVHLAYGPIFGPEGSLFERASTFRTLDGRSIGMHEVPNLVRQVSVGHDRAGLRELQALIERLRPDIVHTHSSKAGILGRIAAWRANATSPKVQAAGIIHTIHGPPFMPVEGGLLSRVKIALNNAMYTIAERHAAKRCHVIASVANAMTEQFLARGIGNPAMYRTVYSGMEVERYLNAPPDETRQAMRAKLGFADDDFVIGTVARLAQHKGHDDLLEGLGALLRLRPSWKLLWVGDGWWRERLLKRISELGLAGRVITTGLVPSERVAGHMRAMDVLVHPSYREGLPRTVPQALLCGVCPVAYDVDGTNEVCVDGKTGRLVPLGDANGLGQAVEWLCDHPREREEMAARGRADARERFSTRKMVNDLEVVYGQALEKARG